VSLGRWCYPRGLIDPPVAVELAGAPLRLYERGVWIPGDEYWGELGDVVPVVVVEVIAVARGVALSSSSCCRAVMTRIRGV
jgi:hypothetical protein